MNPREPGNENLRSLLKRAFPTPPPRLDRDLWPPMLARMERHAIRVHWFDWVLLAAVFLALALLFPQLIPQIAYQL